MTAAAGALFLFGWVFLILGLVQHFIFRAARTSRLSSGDRLALEADVTTLEDGPLRRQLALRLAAEDDPRRPRRLARLCFVAALACFALPCLT